MAINPIFENIRLSEKNRFFGEPIKVDCKTDVDTESIVKILSVKAFKKDLTAEIENGTVSFMGKIHFCVFYEDVDGELNKCECVETFNGKSKCEGVLDGAFITTCSKIEKTGYDVSGAKLSLFAVVKTEILIEEQKDCPILTNGEGIIVNKKESTFLKSFGLKKQDFTIEEEFEINYAVKEVLSQEATATVSSVNCGVGSVIVEGDIQVSALLLQTEEKSDIIKEEKSFPFRIELPYEEAMPSMNAVIDVVEKTYKTDISVDEENKKSSVLAKVCLTFLAEVSCEESIATVTDAFSLTENTELEFINYEYEAKVEQKTTKQKVSGKASIDISKEARIIAVNNENAEVLDYSIENNGIKVNGILSMTAYLKDADNKNFSIVIETPFTSLIDAPLDKTHYVITATSCCGEARIISLTEAEIEADVAFNVKGNNKEVIKCIKGVTSSGEKPLDKSAISVYIPLENEELFPLSKRLNVCPDELVLINKDLQFPLTGKERIVVYRKK